MKTVEEYIDQHSLWSDALNQIHETINATELECNIKWGAPVYSLNGKNVIGLGAFKNHFGVWFFQGVFLKDQHKILVNAQEGKTKALRQMKFKSSNEVDLDILKAYVTEAIQNQKDGKVIKNEKTKIIDIAEELQAVFKANKPLEKAFKKLSPGKQKDYANYISEAKRASTKQNRLEKIIPMIEQGIGLYDKYKNC